LTGLAGTIVDVESASTPVCWLCRGPIVDRAVWRHVDRKGHPLYRPCCPDCRSEVAVRPAGAGDLCHGEGGVAGSGRISGTCEVCDIEVWHTDTDRTFPYVACCFPHLDEARRRRPPPRPPVVPPEPRPCRWCGETFTPRRRSDAWFCEKACAQRARRHARRVGLDELAPNRQRRSRPVAAYIPEDE
jgi:hypothetical protein